MTGILEKHANDNWYTRTYDDFERRLEAGKLPIGALRSWDCYGARCPLCDESVTAFRYKGERYYLHNNNKTWYVHQCPDPNGIGAGGGWPDDPEVRDGDGELRSAGWFDTYPDDPYSYPDIPYVDPTR